MAVRDDDTVAVVDGPSVYRLFASHANGMDDPRDVAVGPSASASATRDAAGAAGSSGKDLPVNLEPRFSLLLPDGNATRVIDRGHNETATLALAGADGDGDVISYRIDTPLAYVSLQAGSQPGAATLTVNTTAASPGVYHLRIIANDGTEDEWESYAILIADDTQ